MRLKTAGFSFITMSVGFLLPLLVLEIILHFLPVRTGLATMPVNETHPVQRFTINRDFTYSKGWFFDLVNYGHVNNYGYVNDIDYDPSLSTPLLAVIGDSYVEAAMVPYKQTIQGRLGRTLSDSGVRVYSFGASGAALSQYLAFAKYARDSFHPDAMVIVVIGNDFDESLCIYSAGAAHHCYWKTDNHNFVLKRNDYEPSILKNIARKSALIRYVYHNTGGFTLLTTITNQKGERYVGNKLTNFDQEKLELSKKVVDQFLKDLPTFSGLSPEKIAFIVDGIRPQLYHSDNILKVKNSYFAIMRRYFMEKASARNFEVIDMQPRFIKSYLRNKERFEFENDNHWNSEGHFEAAKAVSDSNMLKSLRKQ